MKAVVDVLAVIARGLVPAALLWLLPVTRAEAEPSLVITPATTVVAIDSAMRYSAVFSPNGPGSLAPQYLDSDAVTWSSSDPAVLDMSSGVATGKARGTVTITARYQGLSAQTIARVAGVATGFSLVTPDGRTRTYTLYTPDSYTGAVRVPLVVVYHGTGGTGPGMMTITLMNAVADRYGFLVAYPDGVGSATEPTGWNAGGTDNFASDNHVDDVGFTRLLIADVAKNAKVDAARVYATGFSDGGAFTQRLGFELADQIAAIAPVSGTLVPGGDFVPTPPTRAVPVIEFHGTTDEIVPFMPSVPATIGSWLGRDGVPSSSGVISYRNGIETCQVYPGAAVVTLCAAQPPMAIDIGGVFYDGGGHAWPGGERGAIPGSDIPTPDIDASTTIWKFFATSGASESSAIGLATAVLPGSRSVTVGGPATAFVTIINAGSVTATGVGIVLATPIPAAFSFQTTDPRTNAVTGTPNTPVDIEPGHSRTFVVTVTPTTSFIPTDVGFDYGGNNTVPVARASGVNTFLVSASSTPVPDIVAVAATLSNDGIATIQEGATAFAVATVNVGAAASITATVDTGSVGLPVDAVLCRTDPSTAQCTSTLGPSVTIPIASHETATFSVFVGAGAAVAFDPAKNRIFVRFEDANGVTRGATSVAVRTQ